jgi:hypothetical protein
VAARPTRTRVAALLLVGAALVVAILSTLLSAGVGHRSASSAGIFGTVTRTAAVTTAARGSHGQTVERGPTAAAQHSRLAQLSQTGASAAGQHLTAALAGAALLFALAGRRLSSRARPRTPSDTERATQRNRGPPRAAVRLA